jgi:hypothetical protein
MPQNVAIENYIGPTDVSHIKGLKESPLRYVSTNPAENKEHVYEEIIDDYARVNYDTIIARSSKNYDYLDFAHYNGTANKKEQISFIKNRNKIIIFSSILFVIAIVVIIAVIMTVLATASKRI